MFIQSRMVGSESHNITLDTYVSVRDAVWKWHFLSWNGHSVSFNVI